ncbi:putative transcription factor MADS-type1 family [Helianthus annuus]|nr:putative transcription factor MADS-type1 family [Helianthus annuus]
MMPRKRKGRQRIQMARSEKASTLLVTFSKCCCGLFTNASELSILCGVEIAIFVFSPGKKIFSFGDPSVEMIVDSFRTKKNHAWISVVEQGKMFIISWSVKPLSPHIQICQINSKTTKLPNQLYVIYQELELSLVSCAFPRS